VDFLPGGSGRWRGIGIGIAAGLKLTPLLFVAYLVLTGRWRDALRALAAFAATILVGWAVVPTDSRAYWLHGIFYKSSRMVPGNILVNHSLPGFFARLEHTTAPPSWTLAISAVVGLLCLAAAVWAHRLGQDMVGMLVIAFTAQLVSPITWMHHGVWVVPALIWLGRATWREGTVLPRVVLGLATVWYLVPVWVLGQRPSGHTAYQWTVPGNVLETLTGNLVPAVLALALLPVWLRRLRPPAGQLPAIPAAVRPEARSEEAVGK
jgi:alpha-1,2-mannosyltransferase